MPIKVGVIADDFTGATDIAGFLVEGGLRTAQVNGVPVKPVPTDVDAVVVSLKTRSIDPEEAVRHSLAALQRLEDAGAQRIFFKYCSTFDSTPKGNIGPVTDALMDALGVDVTVVAPGLPVNGRTVYNGHLFVNGEPLDESGMRNHPVTPMKDSSLVRLMEGQSRHKAGVIPFEVVEEGPAAVRRLLNELAAEGISYVVLDTVTNEHLTTLGEAISGMRLVTGGSGLGGGLAEALHEGAAQAAADWAPVAGRAVVLSGSASDMTNAQVSEYKKNAPSLSIDVDRLMQDRAAYRDEILQWFDEQVSDTAPMIYATAQPEAVRAVQEQYGAQAASEAIEELFGELAQALRDRGVSRFIVAGGETSGAVTTALGVDGFHVGPQIAPGVPWVRSLDGAIELALKSGNFGAPDFFTRAQSERDL